MKKIAQSQLRKSQSMHIIVFVAYIGTLAACKATLFITCLLQTDNTITLRLIAL